MAGSRELAASLAFLDAVADEMGEGSLSPVVEKESVAALARVAALIEPVMQSALGAYLEKCELQHVRLHSDRPFSDESLSGALSRLLGVPVASIKDRAALKMSFRAAVQNQVSIAAGYPFENIYDKKLLFRDVLRATGQRSSRLVPGLELRDLSSKEITKEDFILYGQRMLSDLTGVNFTNLRDKQAIKEDVYAYVMPIIRAEITGEVMVTGYKRPLRMDRKSVRNRERQRRFRAQRGNRDKYVGVRAREEGYGG